MDTQAGHTDGHNGREAAIAFALIAGLMITMSLAFLFLFPTR